MKVAAARIPCRMRSGLADCKDCSAMVSEENFEEDAGFLRAYPIGVRNLSQRCGKSRRSGIEGKQPIAVEPEELLLRIAGSLVGATNDLGKARSASNRIHPRIPHHDGRA